MISRAAIQSKIDQLRGDKNITLSDLNSSMSSWLDSQDLTYEGLEQAFLKTQILSDLNSYEGVI